MLCKMTFREWRLRIKPQVQGVRPGFRQVSAEEVQVEAVEAGEEEAGKFQISKFGTRSKVSKSL